MYYIFFVTLKKKSISIRVLGKENKTIHSVAVEMYLNTKAFKKKK